jgi:hypothetical protein
MSRSKSLRNDAASNRVSKKYNFLNLRCNTIYYNVRINDYMSKLLRQQADDVATIVSAYEITTCVSKINSHM